MQDEHEDDNKDNKLTPTHIRFSSQEDHEHGSEASGEESEIEKKKAIRKEKKERRSKKGGIKAVTGLDAIEGGEPKETESSKKKSSNKPNKRTEVINDVEMEDQIGARDDEEGNVVVRKSNKSKEKKSSSKANKGDKETLNEDNRTESNSTQAIDLQVISQIKTGKSSESKDNKSQKSSKTNSSRSSNKGPTPIQILRPSTPSQAINPNNQTTQTKQKTPSKQTDLLKWKKSPDQSNTMISANSKNENKSSSSKQTNKVGANAVGETVNRYTTEEARLVHRVIGEREVQFAVRVIQSQINDQQLNKEDISGYTDFQQAQILMTLIWDRVQEKHSDINSENFVRATHSMEVNNLIEVLNNPSALPLGMALIHT
jgi:hypothetical protein